MFVFLFCQSGFSSLYLYNDTPFILKAQVVTISGLTIEERLLQPDQTVHIEESNTSFPQYQVFWYLPLEGDAPYKISSVVTPEVTVVASYCSRFRLLQDKRKMQESNEGVFIENKAEAQFFAYQNTVEHEIARGFSFFGEKSQLRSACEDALTNNKGRYRSSIVLMLSEALGKGLDVSHAALSVEFLHTASLIADKLPYINEAEGEKTSIHKVYGESVALLSSYVLITASFDSILSNTRIMRESGLGSSEACDLICRLALESAAQGSGVLGAPGASFLDSRSSLLNIEMIKKMIYRKNIRLFEMAFVLGWLFGGGDVALLENIKQAAYHFGMAFQIANDLGNRILDEKKQRDINIVTLIGKEKSLAMFKEEMALFEKYLKELYIDTPSFREMSDMLYQQAI